MADGLRPAMAGEVYNDPKLAAYDVTCQDCGAVIARLDPSAVVPLRDALEERLIAEHVCVE
jgi:hypothetical protein